MFKLLCLFLLATAVGLSQNLASPYSNAVFAPQNFTSSGQTGKVLQLNGLTVASTVGSSFASGTITVTGVSLTTVTFTVQGSSDNGITYFPLPVNAVASPGTLATVITATTSGMYQVSLAGLTHVRFVTSGTFTATSVSITLTASPNALTSRNSGGGSGGGATLPATPSIVKSVTTLTSTPAQDGIDYLSPATGLPNTGGTLTGGLGQSATNCFTLNFNACQNLGLMFGGLRSDTSSLHIDGQNINTYWLSPGRQLGNIGFGSGLWTSHLVENNLHSLAAGNTLFQFTNTHTAPGDSGIFTSTVTYGGAIGASDQGAYGISPGVNESAFTYEGVVSSGGVGVTSVKTNCSGDCGNQGQGRTLINLSRPVTSGFLIARVGQINATPAQLTISSTVPVSTAWGLLASNVATPWGVPTGVGTTSETFNVNINSTLGGSVSPGQFNAGDLVCFGGIEEEQARIASVGTPASGVQSITVNLREPHAANTWIMANGACGTYIDLLAAHNNSLRFPIPVIGSTSANALQAVSFAFGGPPSGQESDATSTNLFVQQFGARNFSNGGSGTTVSMQLTGLGFQNVMQNAPSIWITEPNDAALSGKCTNATFNTTTGLLSCTIAALTGSHITTDTGNFAISSTNASGNGDFVLYPGASVLDVQNETASAACSPSNQACLLAAVDGTFTIEPNNVTFTVGDLVEQPHHYMIKMHGLELYPSLENPGPAQFLSNVIDARLQGPMTNGINLANTNNNAMYQYFGGLLSPPNFLNTSGLWRFMLNAHNAPANGGAVLSIGASPSGDTDVNYSYDIFSGHSPTCGQANTLQLVPSTDTINLNCQKFNVTTSLLFTFNGAQVASIAPSANGVSVNGSVGITGGLSTTGNLGVAGVINAGLLTNFVRDSFNFSTANWALTGSPTIAGGQADEFGTNTATLITTTAATTLTDGGGNLGANLYVACVRAKGTVAGQTFTVNAYGLTGPTETVTTAWATYCTSNTRNTGTGLSMNIAIPSGESILFEAAWTTLGGAFAGSGAAAWAGAIPSYLPTTGVAKTTPVAAIVNGNSVIVQTTPDRNVATFVSGTVTVTDANACTTGAACSYTLSNCGPSGTAIGLPSLGTVTAGTSFVINSISATNTVVTGDTSKICYRIN